MTKGYLRRTRCKVKRSAVFMAYTSLALVLSHPVTAQVNVDVDQDTNKATTFLTDCAATYQYLTDLATGAGSAQESAQFAQMVGPYRYLATIYAAILFPEESAEYADSIAGARINGRLAEWASTLGQGGEAEVTSTVRTNMTNCAELNDPNVVKIQSSSVFPRGKAKIDASEYAL